MVDDDDRDGVKCKENSKVFFAISDAFCMCRSGPTSLLNFFCIALFVTLLSFVLC